MKKRLTALSKYIITFIYLMLPSPAYMCIQSVSSENVAQVLFAIIFVLSYLLLSLFIASFANEIKYWVVSGAFTALLICALAALCSNNSRMVTPSYPFALGQVLLDLGLKLPTILSIPILWALKVFLGVLFLVVYKLFSSLSHKKAVSRLNREALVILISLVVVALTISVHSIVEEIQKGFDMANIFTFIVSPLLCVWAAIFVMVLAVINLLAGMGSIGAPVFILLVVVNSLLGIVAWRKLNKAGKKKAIFNIRIIGSVVFALLYVACAFVLRLVV